ncbi:MAG: P1 family peptidase, partial [Candidatus Poribacteria bacterium]|nr:P1 family peptidase [Candidatus Poribacteria bacterium]
NGGRRHQLRIDGVPVGKEIRDLLPFQGKDGSFIIVIATDAPLTHRQLRQLCLRATHGLARTGTPSTMSSGEFVIAFSTANKIPRRSDQPVLEMKMLRNRNLDPLYQAVIETTEEAVYNSMTMASTMTGKQNRTIPAIPLDRLGAIMKKYGH